MRNGVSTYETVIRLLPRQQSPPSLRVFPFWVQGTAVRPEIAFLILLIPSVTVSGSCVYTIRNQPGLSECSSLGCRKKPPSWSLLAKANFISDEIYACSTFDSGETDATPFTSALAMDADGLIDTERLHVTYGLSEDFGTAGLHIGAIVTRNKAVETAIRGVMRFHNPAGPSLVIGAAMLEDRKWCRDFVESSRHKLAAAFRHATQGLRGIGVGYLRGSNAGLFLWIDLSPYLPPDDDLGGEPNAGWIWCFWQNFMSATSVLRG